MTARTAWLLVRRGLRAAWGTTAVLAVVALTASGAGSAALRALDRLHTDQLASATAQLSPVQRDLTLTPLGPVHGLDDWDVAALSAPPWDGYLRDLDAVRAAQPALLRGVLRDPHVLASGRPVGVQPARGTGINQAHMVPRAAPDLQDHVRLVEGRWPQVTPFGLDYGPSSVIPPELPPGLTTAEIAPVQVVAAKQAVDLIGWKVGQVRERSAPLPPLVLVGAYVPDDPADPYWAHAAYGAAPKIERTPLGGVVVTFAGTVADALLAPMSSHDISVTAWSPLDLASVPGSDVGALAAELRAATSRTVTATAMGVPLRPSTGTSVLLDRVLAQRSGVDAVLAVTAAGPLGALVVVLALGARLVVERRRTALAVLRVRGASAGQLRAVAAAEGAVAGVPGAALGFVIGLVAVPGRVGLGQLAVAVVAGLAPAAALAVTAASARIGADRTDLGHSPRWRSWAEALVLALAAVSTGLLLTRGVVASAAGATGAVDPVVALAPPLLCLAVALLAVRAVPWVLAPLERALARGRALVPFLGAARSRRDTAGGVLPAIALVACVAVAASAAVLRTTVDRGIDDASWARIGADVRIADVWVSPDQVAALRSTRGVADVATIGSFGTAALTPDGSRPTDALTVVSADAAALAHVQRGVPGAPDAAALARLTVPGDALPVLVSASSGLHAGQTGTLAREASAAPPLEVTVVGVIAPIPGMPAADRFMVADGARLAAALETPDLPNVALVRLDAGVPAHGVPTAVRAAVASERAALETPATAAAQLRSSPSTAALTTASVLALALGGLLTGLTLVLTLLLAGPARTRLLAVLHSLGGRPRQARALAAWETVPWVAVALVAGAVLAWLVPVVVLAAVDLTPLTGGAAQPALQAEPWALAAIAAGLVVLALAAAGVVSLLGRRGRLAVLRAGEDA